MEIENFKKMVELQHSFNIQVAGEDYLQKNLPWDSAIIAESGELLESYGYKWWKKQEQDLANVKVEAVDLLHFVISFYLDVNYNYGNDDKESRDSFDFIAQTTKEFERAFTNNEVYKTDILPLINMLNSDEYDRFETMKQMFIKLEMTNEDVYIAYIVKNCLNKFRADNGYKDGTYIKDWNGKEDNVVAYTIAEEWGADNELFEHLYIDLETYYNEEVKNV
jgi:dimeric dUTPase (all-alpha-NTP-PPase superfamily)